MAQLQPYAALQSACVAFALHGVRVPEHVVLSFQTHDRFALQVVAIVKPEQGTGVPLHV
jgi:hypothetical protein